MSYIQQLTTIVKKRPMIIVAVLVFGMISVAMFFTVDFKASVVMFEHDDYLVVVDSPTGTITSYTASVSIEFMGLANDHPFISIPSFSVQIVGADGWKSSAMTGSVGEYYATGYISRSVTLPSKDQTYKLNMVFTVKNVQTGSSYTESVSSDFRVRKYVAVHSPGGVVNIGNYDGSVNSGQSVSVPIEWTATDADGDLVKSEVALKDNTASKVLFTKTVYSGASVVSKSGTETFSISNYGSGDSTYTAFLKMTDSGGRVTIEDKTFKIYWIPKVVVDTRPTSTYSPTPTEDKPASGIAGFELLLTLPVMLLLYVYKRKKARYD